MSGELAWQLLAAVLFVAWVAETVLRRLDAHAAAAERRQLCERIQAGTLQDYQRHRERPPIPAPAPAEPPPTVEELTRLEPDEQEDLLHARARSAGRRLFQQESPPQETAE